VSRTVISVRVSKMIMLLKVIVLSMIIYQRQAASFPKRDEETQKDEPPKGKTAVRLLGYADCTDMAGGE